MMSPVVAPYVGAWIETHLGAKDGRIERSHPTWVRGLKLVISTAFGGHLVSHPTWVRGLKP